MITNEQRTAIHRHINELVGTGSDAVLHAEVREIVEDDGGLRIMYRTWFVMAHSFDCEDPGAIWSETGYLWIAPQDMDNWEKYGARDSHFNWEDLASGPDDICSEDIPHAAVLGWIQWMSWKGHWDRLIEHHEGRAESVLKGFPRGTRKAFREARAELRRRSSLPIIPRRGGLATGMGIVSAEEYRELTEEDMNAEK
jgi:hypothetical protein